MSGMLAGTNDSWKRMLEARPVHNAAARIVSEDETTVSICVKTAKPWYLVPPVSWIVPVRSERRTELDRLGSEVWRFCDGKATVESIIDSFASSHRLTFHEARVAVTGYLRTLIRRGVLAIDLPKEGS